MNVVDSSGWMEYLQDSPRADLFAPAIEQRDRLIVPVIALYEVHKILSRKLPERAVTQALDVMRLGRVVELTDSRAIAAAVIAARHKLAMADAVMYSIALEHKATFWTQDVDYQGLESVRYCPKPASPPA
jgi:predicted nucleic acid-binding protein